VRAGEPDENGDREDPAGFGDYHDLFVFNERGTVVPVPDGVLVNGRFYTHAVLCTGRQAMPDLMSPGTIYNQFTAGGRYAATKADGYELYRVGPIADLPWAVPDYNARITTNPENRVSMHRLVPLTAALAGSLKQVVV
jgi:hypothetical protein